MSNKNFAKILQEIVCLHEFSKIRLFCKILQVSSRAMHNLRKPSENLATILKEKHFGSTGVVRIPKGRIKSLTIASIVSLDTYLSLLSNS